MFEQFELAEEARSWIHLVWASVFVVGLAAWGIGSRTRKLEIFGYDRCGEVFKDAHEANLHNVYVSPSAMTSEADALLKVILRDDQNVFERMLSTSEIVVKHSGAPSDGPAMESMPAGVSTRTRSGCSKPSSSASPH